MAELYPVLDFIHELRQAGHAVDYWTVLGDPQGQWNRLPAESRSAILARIGAHAWDASTVRVGLSKRRGRGTAVDRVFLRLEPDGPGRARPFHALKQGVLYTQFKPTAANGGPPSVEPHMEVAEAALQDAGWARGRGSIVDLLDSVWGEAPYDLKETGNLCEFRGMPGHQEIERYWIEEPFAMVVILRDPEGVLLYHIEEPKLSDLERALIATINDRLRDVLILDKDEYTYRAFHLARKVFELLKMYRTDNDRRVAYKIGYYFIRNYLGMGRLEPYMSDPLIEDVSCNGPRLPAFVAHSRHQSLKTELVFDELELNSFTIKLAQRGGKLLSVAQPLVDATLPDGSRLQAALGREVTSRGSAFTIRKFREDPLTAVDLIRLGTHSVDTIAFLWQAVEMRRSMVIMGATASGKTTTLNCLSQFIPPSSKIVSIEDTREITLQHENWLAAVTREGIGASAGDSIGMFDLLRAALRQRPEYIIVGEIRGAEGLTLFQAMSTGHTCFSTMHAGSVENAVYRLENQPIGVPRVMLTSLDFFIIQGQADLHGRQGRRMMGLTELNGIDPQSRNLRMNEIFHWDPETDKHNITSSSYVIDSARAKLGWSRQQLEDSLKDRSRVLQGLVDRNERHYRDVARAVRKFYSDHQVERADTPSIPSVAVPVDEGKKGSKKVPVKGK